MWRLLFFLPLFALFADKAPITKKKAGEEYPWFTGPLIALSPEVIERGHINIEPYVFALANTGVYDSEWKSQKHPTLWNLFLQPQMTFGLTKFMDFYILPTIYYNLCESESSWGWGDLNLGFDFQLYHDVYVDHDWYPNVKFSLREVFPTGKYDRLNPKKKGTEIGGEGTFDTLVELVVGKLFHFTGIYFLSSRLVFTYTVSSPVSVHGFNFYGGGAGTKGTVYPGQTFNLDLALECALSRNWAFAIDLIGNWESHNRFKGNLGASATPIATGSSFQFTLAPALEYNWSPNWGVIFGSWFTAAGRNAPQFFSGVIAVNYYK